MRSLAAAGVTIEPAEQDAELGGALRRSLADARLSADDRLLPGLDRDSYPPQVLTAHPRVGRYRPADPVHRFNDGRAPRIRSSAAVAKPLAHSSSMARSSRRRRHWSRSHSITAPDPMRDSSSCVGHWAAKCGGYQRERSRTSSEDRSTRPARRCVSAADRVTAVEPLVRTPPRKPASDLITT